MKVKLLRKLRKRFHWYFEPDTWITCWLYYDKKKNLSGRAFVSHVSWPINDMLLYTMLCQLGREKWFVSLRKRLERKSDLKNKRRLKQQFSDKF